MVILKTIVLSVRLLFHLSTFSPDEGEVVIFYLTPIKNWANRLFRGPQSLRTPFPDSPVKYAFVCGPEFYSSNYYDFHRNSRLNEQLLRF